MCGIFGFTGRREAAPLLLDGLKRLEYRGYDSAGMVTGAGRSLHLRKKAGRIAELAKVLGDHPAPGSFGISHTRWATHGRATDRERPPPPRRGRRCRRRPQRRHRELRRRSSSSSRPRASSSGSDTDTEVIAHLVANFYDGRLAGRGRAGRR